jgi:hypothetical protein
MKSKPSASRTCLQARAAVRALIEGQRHPPTPPFLPVQDKVFTQCSNIINRFCRPDNHHDSRPLLPPSSALPPLW